MPKVIKAFAALVVAGVLAVYGSGKIEKRNGGQRFISDKYGFSMLVPAKWFVSSTKDTPMYINFDPRKSPRRQLELPKGGASISVVALEDVPKMPGVESPYDWARFDVTTGQTPKSSIKPLELPESEITHAVISSYDEPVFSADDQPQHCVAIFWEFKNQLFGAHLYFVLGDPNAKAYEETFLESVKSIRALAVRHPRD